MTTKSVLGVEITIDNSDVILEEIKKYLKIGNRQKALGTRKNIKPFVIFTPNPEIISYAQKDSMFKEIVNSSQINIPDGMGVVWALKKLYGINVKRLSGADLMLDLCQMAEKESLTVGLIGGRNKVALKVRECLLKKYPRLKIRVLGEPEVEIRNSKFEIRNKFQISNNQIKNTDILFVGLGFPKQEYFISSINQPIVMMAVGGTFDYLAGRAPRAPVWLRDANLEWLYRLILEPSRLPRQIAGAEFFFRVLTSG